MARLLLDECVPKRLARLIVGHEARTVSDMQWTSAPDRSLLRRASDEGFDAVITVDRSLAFQQRVSALPLTLIVLRARTNRYAELSPLLPKLLTVIEHLAPGTVVTVSANHPDGG